MPLLTMRAALVAAMAISFGIGFANATTGRCTRQMEDAAIDRASQAHEWKYLYFSYRKYVACDDGAIAEGWSDDVERLLTQKWHEAGKFEPLRTDPGFAKFVVKHVDELMSPESAKTIAENAKSNCPMGLLGFCKAIVKATEFKPQ